MAGRCCSSLARREKDGLCGPLGVAGMDPTDQMYFEVDTKHDKKRETGKKK
jgi:hypothetical protein